MPLAAAAAGRSLAGKASTFAVLAGLVLLGAWAGRCLFRWANAQADRQAVWQATHPQPNVRPH